jgi:hypothetical protein
MSLSGRIVTKVQEVAPIGQEVRVAVPRFIRAKVVIRADCPPPLPHVLPDRRYLSRDDGAVVSQLHHGVSDVRNDDLDRSSRDGNLLQLAVSVKPIQLSGDQNGYSVSVPVKRVPSRHLKDAATVRTLALAPAATRACIHPVKSDCGMRLLMTFRRTRSSQADRLQLTLHDRRCTADR